MLTETKEVSLNKITISMKKRPHESEAPFSFKSE